MKKSKLFIIIISVLVAIPVIIFAFFSIPWLMIYGGIWLSPDPPKPQITFAEFPFELVYTLDGKTITINDVYVCEYDGIDIDEGQGKHLKWKSYIKNSNLEKLVLFVDDNKQIICDIGAPGYYMGDPKYYEIYGSYDIVPNLILIEDYEEITSTHDLSEEEMNSFKIELISWEFSKPIKNTFK